MKCFVIYLDYPLSQLYGKNKDDTTSLFIIVNPAEWIGLNLITNVSKYMKK